MQADCAVEIVGNAYSVAWRLIGETVRATIADGMVRINHGIHEVTVHPICIGRRRRVADPQHLDGLASFTPSRGDELVIAYGTLVAGSASSARRVQDDCGRRRLMPAAMPDRLSDMLTRLKLTAVHDQLDGLWDKVAVTSEARSAASASEARSSAPRGRHRNP